MKINENITIGQLLDLEHTELELLQFLLKRTLELYKRAFKNLEQDETSHENFFFNIQIKESTNLFSESDFALDQFDDVANDNQEKITAHINYFMLRALHLILFALSNQIIDKKIIQLKDIILSGGWAKDSMIYPLQALFDLENMSNASYSENLSNLRVKIKEDESKEPRKRGGQTKHANRNEKLEPYKKKAIKDFNDPSYRKKNNQNGQKQTFADHFCSLYQAEVMEKYPELKGRDGLTSNIVKKWLKENEQNPTSRITT